MRQGRIRPPRILPQIMLILLIPIIFAPMILHMIAERGADYQPHIAFAMEMADGTREILPHPLFHLGVILTHAVMPGAGFTQAGFLFAIFVYLALGAVIYGVYVRPVFESRLNWKSVFVAIFVTLSLMTISAVTIFTWGDHNLYWGYILPNMYHSPTLTTMRPLTLLLFIYIVGVFSSSPFFKTWLAVLIAAILMILTTFAKPHYTIAVLPAIGLIVLYRLYRRQTIHWSLLIFGIGLPAIAVIVIQMLMLRTSSVGGGSIQFAPFEFFNLLNINGLLLKFVMSVLFPLAVYILYFRQARHELSLNLSWLTFLVGAFYGYFLVESDRVSDGNFVWSGQITVFVLLVVSAVFFLRQIYEPGKGFTFNRAAVVCVVIWLLHVASGVLWYATEISSVAVAERWW